MYGAFTRYGAVFQAASTSSLNLFVSPTTPEQRIDQVWANPLSLATTYGITIVFSSSRYLDVSVPRVFSHLWVLDLQSRGFPHSDIYGSTLVCNSP